jgi:hypothetical protein
MAAGTHNLVIDQGSDFTIRLTLSQGGAPINLTNYFARAQLRSSKTAVGTPIASFACTVDTPNTDGKITVSLPNATSKNLTPGKYYYDLEIYTAGDAQVTRMLQGDVTLTPEVTR